MTNGFQICYFHKENATFHWDLLLAAIQSVLFLGKKLLLFIEIYLTVKDWQCTIFKKIHTLSFPCYKYRVRIIKKFCFVKKLDNNPMLCSKCEYNHDMIINKCLGLKNLKEQQKICIFLWIFISLWVFIYISIDKICTYNAFIIFHVNVFQHSLKQAEKFYGSFFFHLLIPFI